ncbi:MAG TPA: hypothetical protein VMG12_08975 [Polyangiaceae bacterium]|nr:hypothetical protein [Polyangiaceae bacterium]
MGRGWTLLACTGLWLGCGSRSGLDGEWLSSDTAAVYPWQAAAAYGGARAPRTCVEDWRVLYESEAFVPPALAVSAGELIFIVNEFSAIGGVLSEVAALDLESPSGGERVITQGSSFDDLWLDGDALALWTGQRLLQVSMQGGRQTLMLEPGASDASVLVERLLLEDDAFYWAQTRTGSTSREVWRQPRGDGEPQRIGAVDAATVDASLLAATPDTVVLAGGSQAVALSLRDGASRALDRVSEGVLVGVDGLGAYYSRVVNRTRRGGEALRYEIRRAPVDGSGSTRFWQGSPGEHLTNVWPTESGWLAAGLYYRFDGRQHAVLMHIDASGHETLIGCDRSNNVVLGGVVFWRQAFYAVTLANNRSRVVEIRLPD